MKLAINEATTMSHDLKTDIIAYGKAGFEGVELWWDKVKAYLESNTTQDLSDLLEQNNIKPIALCPFLMSPFRTTQDCRDEFTKAVEVATAIDCDTIIVCPDFQPLTKTRSEAFAMHRDELRWYADAAKAKKLKLAVEAIGLHTLVGGSDDALELIGMLSDSSNVGLVVDTFHYSKSDITMEEILRIPQEKLYLVHVNDSPDGMRNEVVDADRVLPYDGVLKLDDFMKTFKQLNYDGYLSCEIFNPDYQNKDAQLTANEAYTATKKLL